ncbi:hypothetical protein MOQ_005820 [Trypanosoma cruzi marinkellei]|uniref:NHL repeat containing protein n=1 Tax=Trypanosoma cruzi marinkellei TaxID=85056 RepID=K2N6R8_TRYCR|nr:hypothetical protein MOQ_005820 [Trypanosoma cruzi marinkellei]
MGGKTGTTTERCSGNDVVCQVYNTATTAAPLAVRPHDMGMAFMSRILFQVPLTAEGKTVRHCCQPGPVLFTFPIDGTHLLVACGSERSQRDGGSTVYVVRLCPDDPPTSLPSRLPIAVISGCVQNSNVPLSPQNGRAFPAPAAMETSAGSSCSVHLREGKADFAARPSVPMGLATEPIPIADDAVHGTSPIKSLPSCSGQLHSFLFADAATHAIWAAEVDTGTLTVRVVPPSLYWGNEEGVGVATAADAKAQQQQQCSDGALKPGTLLGGIEGFVDGPFHVARFASPSALCWRMDDDFSGEKDGEGPRQPHAGRNTLRGDVLFVSDRGNHAIRYVDFQNRLVRTILGIDGVPGYRDGDYRVSRLHEAAALVWCTSGLLFLDKPNGAIRLVTGLKRKNKKEKNKATIVEREQEGGVAQTVAKPNMPVASSEEPTTHAALHVWTVAGGRYGKMGPYVDAKEPHRASLGMPSALALFPGGNGVLFADSQHGALRMLSLRGVETLLGPHNCLTLSSLSRGLIACSHIVACRLVTSDNFLRHAFLVSSGVQGTVSLLVPCDGTECVNDGKTFDLDSTSVTSLLPEECALVANGVLRKYTCIDEKSAIRMMRKSGVISREGKKTYGSGNDPHRKKNHTTMLSSSLVARGGVSSRVPFLAPSAKCGPLDEAMRQLFYVYAYYARKSSAPSTTTGLCPLGGTERPDDVNMSYSLSLIRFWRFLSHTEYVGECPLLRTSSVIPFACMFGTIPGLKSKENGDDAAPGLVDWRRTAEVLHGLCVRQHGYRVLSIMDFSLFCRVILLLHCWMRGQGRCETGQKEGLRSNVDRPMLPSIEGLSKEEVVEAYKDTVRQVRNVNIHLRQAEGEADNEGRGFLAADDVLCVLVRNEKSLQRLFEAFSRKILRHRHSSCLTTEDYETNKRSRLRDVLLPADTRGHTSTDSVYGMSYDMFHKLFHALDVFPTLMGESLLRRAYVDALLTPLFQQQKQQPVLSFAPPIFQDVEKVYACGGAVLSFLPFVEAFVRVALTAFSLCTEYDRRMYPTAAAKVEALMRWVNRSVEQHHKHERGAAERDGPCRSESPGGKRALLSSPLISFDVHARDERRHPRMTRHENP